jgi:hypothetical protein
LFDLVWQFQATLSRLEAKSHIELPDFVQGTKELEEGIEAAATFARDRLPSAPLTGTGHLFERLTSGGTLSYTKLLDPMKEQAQQLRDSMDTSRTIAHELQNTVEQQRREEQAREEENARVLGYGLAALAATAAFPIIIGQLDWDALRKEMHQWAGWALPFQWSARTLQALHPALVFVAMVAAGILIVILSGFLLRVLQRRLLPMDWWRRGELSDMGRTVEELQLLLKVAIPKIAQLGQSRSDSTAAKVRRDIDKLDKKACKRLVRVWEWLIKKESRTSKLGYTANTKVYNKALRARTEWFVISTELVDNRPLPYWLPVALCLYRYKYDSVSDQEFQRVLKRYDFNDDEIKKIDTLVEQSKSLPPRAFVSKLRKAGVSALRDKPLEIPADSLPAENGAK